MINEKLYINDNGVHREYTEEEYAQAEIDRQATLAILPNFVRQKRNGLLKDSDWTQIPDAPVNKQAWAEYRQALRDITKQDGFPLEVIWPTEPQD